MRPARNPLWERMQRVGFLNFMLICVAGASGIGILSSGVACGAALLMGVVDWRDALGKALLLTGVSIPLGTVVGLTLWPLMKWRHGR
jgi:hypothetical protein